MLSEQVVGCCRNHWSDPSECADSKHEQIARNPLRWMGAIESPPLGAQAVVGHALKGLKPGNH